MNRPDAEKIATAFLKTALDYERVSTTLPAPAEVAEGFITVQAVGGLHNTENRFSSPVVQVDVWGYHENSNKLPWGRTAELAMQVRHAIDTHQNLEVIMPSGYLNALVRYVDINTDFRRVPGDEAYARYSADITVHYTTKEAA